jgi:UDP-N-acetylglucosamine acyltransferase
VNWDFLTPEAEMIHPTAIVNPKAELDPSVEIGPYAVIDGDVAMGPGCRVGPHVYLTGHTRIGANNRFYAGCVVGEAPQDVKYNDEPAALRMGDNNLVREGATVHRSAREGAATVIGSNNFLMVNSHVGHNVVLGDHVILANGALLAGHVEVADRAFISGNCLVHQFVRVGTLALMQGGTAISRDLPPYTVARWGNGICGLNVIGLRRAGLNMEERLELKKLYHKLFRSGKNLSQTLPQARREFTSAPARILLDFIATAKRGVCRDSGMMARGKKFNEGNID